jgi:hypothetical protein
MGIFAIWSGMEYPTDAVSMNDGMAGIFVDSDAILKFSEKYPRLAGPLRVEIGRFTEAFIQKIEIVSAGAVPQRLAVLMTCSLTATEWTRKAPRRACQSR